MQRTLINCTFKVKPDVLNTMYNFNDRTLKIVKIYIFSEGRGGTTNRKHRIHVYDGTTVLCTLLFVFRTALNTLFNLQIYSLHNFNEDEVIIRNVTDSRPHYLILTLFI